MDGRISGSTGERPWQAAPAGAPQHGAPPPEAQSLGRQLRALTASPFSPLSTAIQFFFRMMGGLLGPLAGAERAARTSASRTPPPAMTITSWADTDRSVRQRYLEFSAGQLTANFADTDKRFLTVQGSLDVLTARVHSSKLCELTLFAAAEGPQKPGRDSWMGTISLTEYDEPDFDKQFGPGWVTDFVVREDLRGQGCGSQLLAMVLDEARTRGLPDVKLYTESPDAARLYLRNGFEHIAQIDVPDQTNPGESVTCYVMRADLRQPRPQIAA